MKKEYTSWIIEELESKTSAELRDIHTLVKSISEVRGAMKLVKELTK